MRVILHADLNNFYASVERLYNPELKDKSIAVCGSIENRHGIILAKSESAKKLGVKTGMIIRDALALCPDLVLIEAHHDRYLKYSKLVRKIYEEYTDRIESFGIDEAWLDVTGSKIYGSGKDIADELRERVKKELGLTISVGVSFNKVFAKLGSDMKKPDGTTVIDENNYKELVWKLPVSDLLFVGRSTCDKLNKYNISTIGDLANVDLEFITRILGKWGETLREYALGKDESKVLKSDESSEIKSVGNSITCYRNLVSDEDVKLLFTVLAESVADRLVSYDIGQATVLSISVRDEFLDTFTRQTQLPRPSVLADDLVEASVELFKKNYNWKKEIRSLGISVSGFVKGERQLNLGELDEGYQKKLKLNSVISGIKSKYGSDIVHKATVLKDKRFMREEPKETHIIHPDGHL